MSRSSTVFVVDDDPAVVMALGALLVSFGLDVRTYQSAEAFLAEYDEQHGGCLLLDVRLPGMSGLELQELLVTRGSSLPVVFISGHADGSISEKALAGGALAFFAKPCDGAQLYDTIHRALQLGHREAS